MVWKFLCIGTDCLRTFPSHLHLETFRRSSRALLYHSANKVYTEQQDSSDPIQARYDNTCG